MTTNGVTSHNRLINLPNGKVLDLTQEHPFLFAVARGNLEEVSKTLRSLDWGGRMALCYMQTNAKIPRLSNAAEIAAANGNISMLMLLKESGTKMTWHLIASATRYSCQPNVITQLFNMLESDEKRLVQEDPLVIRLILASSIGYDNVPMLETVCKLFSKLHFELALLKLGDETGRNLLTSVLNLCSVNFFNKFVQFYAEALFSPLVRLSENERLNIAQLRIMHFTRLQDGTTMLMLAAATGDIEKFKLVWDVVGKFREAELYATNLNGENLLAHAIASKNPQMVEQVLTLYSPLEMQTQFSERVQEFWKTAIPSIKEVLTKFYLIVMPHQSPTLPLSSELQLTVPVTSLLNVAPQLQPTYSQRERGSSPLSPVASLPQEPRQGLQGIGDILFQGRKRSDEAEKISLSVQKKIKELSKQFGRQDNVHLSQSPELIDLEAQEKRVTGKRKRDNEDVERDQLSGLPAKHKNGITPLYNTLMTNSGSLRAGLDSLEGRALDADNGQRKERMYVSL